MYASGWVIASVRTLLVARLAVMLATVPLEQELHVGHVGARRVHPHSGGDPPDLPVHQPQHDVDVVDHEVIDHGVVLHAGHDGPSRRDSTRIGFATILRSSCTAPSRR